MFRFPSFSERWLVLPLVALLALDLWMPLGAFAMGARLTLFGLLAWIMGQVCASTRTRVEQLVMGGLGVSAMLALTLTCAYYANALLTPSLFVGVEAGVSLVVLLLSAFLPPPSLIPPHLPCPPLADYELAKGEHGRGAGVRYVFLVLIALATTRVFLLTASSHATNVSIRTPWPLLPNGTFLLFGVLLACAYTLALLRTRSSFATLVHALPAFALASLPILLYPLGYGFDGFIHRASQEVLLQTGTLTPKPLYYIGQYVWTMWLEQASDLPLKTLDLWLVPLLLAIVFWISASWKHARTPFFAPLLLLLLPLGSLLITTPQTTSYLLGFLALLLSFWTEKTPRAWIIPLLLSLWAVAAHPLGGLPFACVIGARFIASFLPKLWQKRLMQALGLVGALASIPLAFAAQSWQNSLPIAWSWSWLARLDGNTFLNMLVFPRQTLVLWIDATGWIELLLRGAMLAGGLWLLLRPKHQGDRLLAGAGVGFWLVQMLLEQSAVFSFLIEYERQNYTYRLGVLSLLFLAIPLARWMSDRLETLAKRSGALFAMVLLALIGATCVHFYNALPRHDAGQASSGWSVGKADLEAVRWIHEQGADTTYTVLANQSVSAVALEQFSFFRYAKNDVFYYPLPTSGPLYRLFLKTATTQAKLEDIRAAALLTESKRVYVVLNAYWWEAEHVREHLSRLANRTTTFQERVWVFEFDLADVKTASQ